MGARMRAAIILGLLVQGSIAASLVDLLSRQIHTNVGNGDVGNDGVGNDDVGNYAERPKGLTDMVSDSLKDIDQTEQFDLTDHSLKVEETDGKKEKYIDATIAGDVIAADGSEYENLNTDKTEDQISILDALINSQSSPSENSSIQSTESLWDTKQKLSSKSDTCHLRQSMAYGECGHVAHCPVTCSSETDCTFPYCDSKGQCQCRQAECSTAEMCEFFRIECQGTFTCKEGYCYCQQEEESEITQQQNRTQ
ncbi:uncharacterized protein LOC127857047 isoform X3 [Dreissena polymorpha]|nr:uncharacterized protein LOC127857047 isoform X1 [Dreissena polymorpha]XP_052249300.1 uncharacterized protein LOC127857047 isoform X2 [Dreissena polymorpha]XP_052249301.1 uncharacterized protein LOC127857047 isoform X3 [Dreissena polymorpha]